MCKLTVVIATYNSEKTLKQTLDSIRYQTFRDFEVIIVDGESDDGTIDIIKDYFDIVKSYVSEKDSGIYNAFNKGINMAKGEYTCFIGSDDCYYDYDVFKKVVSHLNDNVDCLSAPIKVVREFDKKEYIYNNRISKDDVLSGMMIPHPGLFVKTDVMRRYYFNEANKVISDYEFLLRYVVDGGEIKFIDDIVVYFSDGGVSGSSVGSKNWNRVLYEHIVLLDKMKLADKQLDVFLDRCLGYKRSNSIGYHIKEIKRIICRKISLFNRVDKYFKKIKCVLPSKKKHHCSLKCCRWCHRSSK